MKTNLGDFFAVLITYSIAWGTKYDLGELDALNIDHIDKVGIVRWFAKF